MIILDKVSKYILDSLKKVYLSDIPPREAPVGCAPPKQGSVHRERERQNLGHNTPNTGEARSVMQKGQPKTKVVQQAYPTTDLGWSRKWMFKKIKFLSE